MAESVRWEGYEVVLDNDTVRFGEGEHDWVKPYPYPESAELQPLKVAFVSRAGRWLFVTSDEYLFTFHSITRQGSARVFNYHWRRLPLPVTKTIRQVLDDAPH
jgi:hypothetical protein